MKFSGPNLEAPGVFTSAIIPQCLTTHSFEIACQNADINSGPGVIALVSCLSLVVCEAQVPKNCMVLFHFTLCALLQVLL